MSIQARRANNASLTNFGDLTLFAAKYASMKRSTGLGADPPGTAGVRGASGAILSLIEVDPSNFAP